jgi:hypothetical protein
MIIHRGVVHAVITLVINNGQRCEQTGTGRGVPVSATNDRVETL